MRVQHNIAAMGAYRSYGNNTSNINKNLEKLSSGYKINRAGDDAAGLAVSEKMRWQISGLGAAQQNCKDAIGMIQTAEGALTEVHSMLNRMYELSIKSANGTYSSGTDRAAMQLEFTELRNEINRIGATCNFNGKKLFDANGILSTAGKMTFAIGEDAKGSNLLQVSDASGGALAKSLTVTTALGIALNNSVGTAANARTAGDKITQAIDKVSKSRAKLGAYQNRLEHTMNNLSVMEENVQNAESNVRDTDVAAEMTKYTKNNILLQSAQAMLAQANQQPQGVLQLLQ